MPCAKPALRSIIHHVRESNRPSHHPYCRWYYSAASSLCAGSLNSSSSAKSKYFCAHAITLSQSQSLLASSCPGWYGRFVANLPAGISSASPPETGTLRRRNAHLRLFAGRWFDRSDPASVIISSRFHFASGGCGLIAFSLDTPIPLIIGGVHLFFFVGITGTIYPITFWGINSLDNSVIQHANALSNTLNQVGASLGTAILVPLSATSVFLFLKCHMEQTMMGDRITFSFTGSAHAIIFIAIAVSVRDNKSHFSGSYQCRAYAYQSR